jgi:hypothetical protein
MKEQRMSSKLDEILREAIEGQIDWDQYYEADTKQAKVDIKLLVLSELVEALKEAQYLPEGITKFKEKIESW